MGKKKRLCDVFISQKKSNLNHRNGIKKALTVMVEHSLSNVVRNKKKANYCNEVNELKEKEIILLLIDRVSFACVSRSK